ncbi:hypothetical protein DENSPDRAFT_930643 [Dentipellis sp. KUC8613]|nr:hypothetical protein DENSPDRAFT_930643 [Dentipellis sp. KUC8613]
MPSRKQLPSFIEISPDGKKARCMICASSPNPPTKQWLQYENMRAHLDTQRHAYPADKDLRKKQHAQIVARRRQAVKEYRDQLARESDALSEKSHDKYQDDAEASYSAPDSEVIII